MKRDLAVLAVFVAVVLQLIQLISGANVTVSNATINITNVSAYEYNITLRNTSLQGGNITAFNIIRNVSTERWAGFYGNVSGDQMVLGDSSGNAFYNWNIADNINSGVICASTSSSLSTFDVFAAQGSDIDTVWGFPNTNIDSGNRTFTGANCQVSFGTSVISSADGIDTGYAGGFETCVLRTTSSPSSKNDLLFCGNVTSATSFIGELKDFEIIVPTNRTDNTFEVYYLYLNIQ